MGVVAEVGSDVVANVLDSVVGTCPTGEDDRRYRGQKMQQRRIGCARVRCGTVAAEVNCLIPTLLIAPGPGR